VHGRYIFGDGQVVFVRLGQVRIVKVRFGQVRLGQVRIVTVRFGQVRLRYTILG
jgi:hypothetical protein